MTKAQHTPLSTRTSIPATSREDAPTIRPQGTWMSRWAWIYTTQPDL